MFALEKEKYTTDYVLSLPEGQRAELIDGVVYDMAAPGLTHQRTSIQLASDIRNYIQSHQGDCEVLTAPFGVFLLDDEKNYVEPDISVICDSKKLTERGCQGAPDWIIEIVSPLSKRMDYYIKLFQYRTAGVREYWIADPDRSTVTVYNFQKENMEQYAFGTEVPAGIYEDCHFMVSNQ